MEPMNGSGHMKALQDATSSPSPPALTHILYSFSPQRLSWHELVICLPFNNVPGVYDKRLRPDVVCIQEHY